MICFIRRHFCWHLLPDRYGLRICLSPLGLCRQIETSQYFSVPESHTHWITTSTQVRTKVSSHCLQGTCVYDKRNLLQKFQWLAFKAIARRSIHVTPVLHATVFKTRIKKKDKAQIQEAIAENKEKMDALVVILNGDKDLAYKLATNETRFVTHYQTETLNEKINLLHSYGFSYKDIVNIHQSLHLGMETVKARLYRMESHKHYSYSLRHLIKREDHFEALAVIYDQQAKAMDGFKSRESFIASVLQCKEEEVVEMVNNGHLHLVKYLLTSTEEVVSLYLKHGITLEDIRNDPTVLRIPYAHAMKKFEVLDQYSVTGKTAILRVMLSTTNERAENYAKMWRLDADALGDKKDRKELLAQELRCSPEEIVKMFAGYEMIERSRPYRLKKTIDLLVGEYDMPRAWIIQNPIVFYYSVERLKYRFEFLQASGVTNLYTIFQSMLMSRTEFLEEFKEFAEGYSYPS